MIHLEKVNQKNIWQLLKLKVHDSQQEFVASNTQSIVEAYLALANQEFVLPLGIYLDDTPIGFVMLGYGDWDSKLKIAKDNYAIWRFMIDEKYQGQGYGKAAMVATLDLLKTFPYRKAEYVYLSYEPENIQAAKLYHSFGFVENGEMDEEEIVACLKLTNI